MMETIRPLRRNRNFQFLWVGGSISDLGSAITGLALPLLILSLTQSPQLAGVAATVSLVSRLALGMPGGVLVDRLDRKRILVACQATRLLALGALAAVVHWDVVEIWHIIAVAAITGGAEAFFQPGHAATIQAVVPKTQLPDAYAQEQARGYVAALSGPPLSGLLMTVGRAIPFLVDALSYLVSLICVLCAKVPRRPVPRGGVPQKKGNMFAEMTDAVRWLWRQRGLRAFLAFALFANPLVGAIYLPLIVLIGERGGGTVNMGLVLAGLGLGGLLGAIMSGRIIRLIPPGRLTILVGSFITIALYAMTLPLGPWWPAVPLIFAWMAVPAINVVLSALIGRLVPAELMGRMSSVLDWASGALNPIAPLLGGFLAGMLGGAGALLTLGSILLVATVVAAMSRALIRLQGFDKEGPAAADDIPAASPTS